MQFGAVYPQAEIGDDPAFIRSFAQQIEAAGIPYLCAFDHILGADPSRFDGPVGGFPSAPYLAEHPFHEVFSLFNFLAGVTTTLLFRPRVVILPQRQTALVAKQAATLDVLSGGRLGMAVGVGWNHAEYEGVGASFATRGRRIEEQIEVLRRLWTEPLVTFDGRDHHLDRVGINPLPIQRPIPLWIGSGPADVSLRRVARLADGWIALLTPDQDLAEAVRRLRRYTEEAGRDPDAMTVETLIGVANGGPDDWRATVEQLAAAGVTHVALASGRDQGRSPQQHLDTLLGGMDALRSLSG
ncbi:MAG: LLM class F420-dependent oxidoreductase [Acidimicrobiia bacterium]